MQKSWNITIDGKSYTVGLDHQTWTNVQKITVNSQIIYESPGRMQVGGITRFTIDGHECAVIISSRILKFSYDLVLDGRSIESKKKVNIPKGDPVAAISNETIGVIERGRK